MIELESELSRSRVSIGGIYFKTTQDDLLKPRRKIGPDLARRRRIPPNPLLQSGEPLGVAERADAGREEIHERAQGEEIAQRFSPAAENLLRRHVRCRAIGQTKLFLHQVGQLIVTGETEVDEHRL